MTMSVGLAKIQNDPEGSISDGRIIIRLNPDGGLIQDEDGLSLAIPVGIESNVDLVSDEYDREWNARLTGWHRISSRQHCHRYRGSGRERTGSCAEGSSLIIQRLTSPT
jgi:hypothetical protein